MWRCALNCKDQRIIVLKETIASLERTVNLADMQIGLFKEALGLK